MQDGQSRRIGFAAGIRHGEQPGPQRGDDARLRTRSRGKDPADLAQFQGTV